MKRILLITGNCIALYGIYGVINDAFIHNHFVVSKYFPGKSELYFSLSAMLLVLPVMGIIMLFLKKWYMKLIGIFYLFFFTWALELLAEALV